MLRSWLTMTTAIASFLERFLRMRVTSIWCRTSRLAVGSSRSRTSGFWTIPLASMTFCLCPALRSLKGRNARCSMPSISRVWRAASMSSL